MVLCYIYQTHPILLLEQGMLGICPCYVPADHLRSKIMVRFVMKILRIMMRIGKIMTRIVIKIVRKMRETGHASDTSVLCRVGSPNFKTMMRIVRIVVEFVKKRILRFMRRSMTICCSPYFAFMFKCCQGKGSKSIGI